MRKRWLLLLVLLPVAAAVSAEAQEYYRQRGGWRAGPIREGLPEKRAGFMFCRLLYTSVRREPGGYGWNTDYPGSDHNFTLRMSQLTTASMSEWSDGEPGYAVVRPTDPELFECPFLFASDIGTAGFTGEEAMKLREYLLKGGFLWVDDFWGERAWYHWTGELERILPGAQIVDLTTDHPLFSNVFLVKRIPQVPSIQHWRRSGGRTSERGMESAEPHMRAVFDEKGRMLVLMSHDTDIADGWEREGEERAFFDSFSPESYAIGANVAVWSMTH